MGRAPTDTKLKLLETAHELIWRNSYAAVSVDGICEKANVKKGSFYHYFPSKADLALATIDWSMKDLKNTLNEIFSPTRHPISRFEGLIDHLYEKQEQMLEEFGHVCGCPFITLGSEMAAQDEAIGARISSICDEKTIYYESALNDLIKLKLIPSNTNVAMKAKEIQAFIVGQLIMARITNDLSVIKNTFKSSLLNLIGVQAETVDAL